MMDVIEGLENAKTQDSVVTIGTFDGVHLGHRQIINRVVNVAREKALTSTMLTFEPHPKMVVNPAAKDQVKILTTLDEKIKALRQLHLQRLIVIKFDQSFAQTGYEPFVKDILMQQVGAKHIVVGYDHAFGKNREGNYAGLQVLSRKYQFGLDKVQPYEMENHVVSSSLIRKAVASGDVAKASAWLGRRFTLSGRVTRGSDRGKSLNFPTANISPDNPNKLIPARGVYAVDVIVEGKTYKGMLNIGYQPTFNPDQSQLFVEVHILNFERDIYDQKIRIEFKQRLRDEKKFDSREALIEQLEKDKEQSLRL